MDSRPSPREYYYIVTVSLPSRSNTRDDALEYVKTLQRYNPQYDCSGDFSCVSRDKHGNSFYLYRFQQSATAATATAPSFTFCRTDVDVAEILIPQQEFSIQIELRYVEQHELKEILQEREKVIQQMKAICSDVSAVETKVNQLEVDSKQLMDKISKCSSREYLDDITIKKSYVISALVKIEVAKEAEKLGYFHLSDHVLTNATLLKYECSRFHSSNPEFVVYSRKAPCAFIIMTDKTDEEEEIDEDGAVIHVDPLGKLLGSMEKVAGDLVSYHLVTHQNLMPHIEIYALIVVFDHKTSQSQVYKLTMNFVDGISHLYSGKQTIPFNDAINRLFFALEHFES